MNENSAAEKNETKFSHCCTVLIAVFLIAVLCWCTWSAFTLTANMEYKMDEATYYTRDSILRNAAYLLLLLAVIWLLERLFHRVSPKLLFLISAAGLTAFLVYLIAKINLHPTWDAYRTLHAAMQISAGDYSSMYAGHYLSAYPFQITLVLYDLLIMKLFGQNYIIFALLNILYLLGIHWCLFQLTGILSHGSDRAQRICVLFTAAFLPLSMYVMFLYSNLPAECCMLAGILAGTRWLQEEKPSWLILAYLFIGIGALLKGTSYIALIALSIAVVLKLTARFRWQTLLIAALSIAAVVGTAKAIPTAMEQLNPKINLHEDLDTEYALEMGSKRSLRGAGWHDGWMETYLRTYPGSYQQKKAEAWRIIRRNFSNRTKHPNQLVNFYTDKLNSMWTNSEFQGFWTIQANKQRQFGKGDPRRQSFGLIHYNSRNDHYDAFTQSYMTGSLNRAIRAYLNAFQNLIYLLCLIHVGRRLIKKQLDAENILPLLTFLGGFLFLIFWEAKAQYSVLFYVLLFPTAAAEIDYWYAWLAQRLANRAAKQ